MKRGKVMGLFSCLLVASISYAAFCLRGFYIKPEIEFRGGTSEDKRTVIKEWFSSCYRYDYPELNIDGAKYAIMDPYEAGPNATVNHVPSMGYLLTVNSQYVASFRKVDGEFQYVGKREILGDWYGQGTTSFVKLSKDGQCSFQLSEYKGSGKGKFYDTAECGQYFHVEFTHNEIQYLMTLTKYEYPDYERVPDGFVSAEILQFEAWYSPTVSQERLRRTSDSDALNENARKQ